MPDVYHGSGGMNTVAAYSRGGARQFGEPTILVHELKGECHEEHVDPDFRAPTPADVKGPHIEP
jgi:hypothetical protein